MIYRGQWPGPLLAALCCLVIAGCIGQDESRSRNVRRQAPFLTAAEAQALSDPNPDVFADLARYLGGDRLILLAGEFVSVVFGDSTLAAADRGAMLSGYRRVTRALQEINQCPEFQAELEFFQALPPPAARRVLDLARQQDRIFTSDDLTPADRLEQVTAVHGKLLAAGYDLAAARGWSYRGTLATRTGRPDLAREMFTAGLDHCRQRNLRSARCNALASLVMQGFAEGKGDSASVLLARGLKLAEDSRLGSQVGRLLTLSGFQSFNQGHYSTAVLFFEESVAACRNLGSPVKGLAYLGILMRLYAAMESWTMVDQVAQRAAVLLAVAEETGSDDALTSLQIIRQDEIRARSAMARGHVEQADAAYNDLWQRVMAQPFEEASFVANFWIMGLLDHGRADLAAAALARAETCARESGLHHMLVRIPFWQARVFFQQGKIDSARISLAEFAAEGRAQPRWTADLQIPYYALHARLLAGVDPQAAAVSLTAGLAALSEHVAASDAGAGAFLDLNRARSLRWAVHDIIGTTPEVGYGLELMWRRLLGVTGRHRDLPFTAQVELGAEARQTARRAEARLDSLGAVHLLYQVRGSHVIRWTAGGSVVCDTLAVSATRLRRLTAAALASLAEDPGDPDAVVGQSLAAVLGELAQALLPGSLRTAQADHWPSLLLLSGEGFLAQIPFAPLNVGTDQQYVPLARWVDLSWVRDPAGSRSAGDGGTNLVIADPDIDPALRRRYSSLAPLVGVEDELAAIRSIMPTEVLRGVAATKAAVVAAMPRASLIYFMGHVLHDPEVPFMTTIPLAAPASQLANVAVLDIAEIRSADLQRCDVVVLSGCGSGLPFVDGMITAPSLGDAFIDAGAGTSLQTFWRIRDAQPVFRPQDVVRLWRVEGMPLPVAVGTVRREAMAGPNGIRHPFGWGAWTLMLSCFPDSYGE